MNVSRRYCCRSQKQPTDISHRIRYTPNLTRWRYLGSRTCGVPVVVGVPNGRNRTFEQKSFCHAKRGNLQFIAVRQRGLSLIVSIRFSRLDFRFRLETFVKFTVYTLHNFHVPRAERPAFRHIDLAEAAGF